MKNLLYSASLWLMIIICLCSTACGNSEAMPEDGKEPIVMRVPMLIENKDGENLMDENVENNILGNSIKATFKGETYNLNVKDRTGDFYLWKSGDNRWIFFDNFVEPPYKTEAELVIDWGNGRVDVVSYKGEYNYEKAPLDFMLYLNGERAEPIYKEGPLIRIRLD